MHNENAGLAAVAKNRAGSTVIRLAIIAVVTLLLHTVSDWRWSYAWCATYFVLQAFTWVFARRVSDGRAGRVSRMGFYVSVVATYALLGAPARHLWAHDGQIGVTASTMLICGLLMHLVVYTMRERLLFWLSASPLILQLLLVPPLALGPGRIWPGLSASICAVLMVGYMAVLWRTFQRSLAHMDQERETALRRQAEADAANAHKSQFLAAMSHEIRTPLNGVMGMVQALAATPLNPSQHEMVKTIDQSGAALLTILDGVLDISKLENGRIELDPVPFRLDLLLTRAAALFESAAAAKGLRLVVDVDPSCEQTVVGDDNRVRQIVLNLLSNAVKFTSVGEVVLRGRLTQVEGQAALDICVQDTGPGLSEDAKAKLFQKFAQGDVSTTRRFGGTGLGLAIARELALLMGGDVSVQSVEDEGALFSLRLQLPLDASCAADVEPPGAPVAAPMGATVRILAAEDNPTNQLVLRTLLEPFGVELTMVENGAQALEAWRANDFDVVLMDVNMPVMDGLQATRAIRALEAKRGAPRTPIVALTANAMADQVGLCTQAGMDAYVAKPIQLASLLEALDRVTAASGVEAAGGGQGQAVA